MWGDAAVRRVYHQRGKQVSVFVDTDLYCFSTSRIKLFVFCSIRALDYKIVDTYQIIINYFVFKL